MSKQIISSLCEFEILVLTGVIAAGQDAYGMTIHEQVEALVPAKRNVSIGAVYTTLGRLEEKGYVKSRFGRATAERGGRAKKHYAVTCTGEWALREALAPMSKAIEALRRWDKLLDRNPNARQQLRIAPN